MPAAFTSEIEAQRSEKVICEIKPVRSTFAAMDIGNVRPEVFWRCTTGYERDSVQLAAVCIV